MRIALAILLAGTLLAPIGSHRTACVVGRWVPSANRMIYPARHVFIPNPACPR